MRKKIIIVGVVSLVVLVAALVLTSGGPASKAKANMLTTPAFPADATVGVWDWQAPDATTTAQKQKDAVALKQQGVTDVYIDISEYNDYDELPPSTSRTAKITTFTQDLHAEAQALSAQGIYTHALAGDVRWSNPDYQYIPLKLLDYVHSYNSTASPDQRLAGIQYDIEFYSAPAYSDDATQNTLDYLSLTQQLINKRSQLFAESKTFALGFAIADWLDGSNAGFMPNVSLNGQKSQPPLLYLLSQLKGKPASYIAVMSYRNHTDGGDGTIARAAAEIKDADATGPVKVLIGEETNKVTPTKLTFYGQSKTAVKQSAQNVYGAFNQDVSFGGFAINDQQGYLALKD